MAGEGMSEPARRPWYIGLLLGVAGWFAGIFVLIVAGMLFMPNSPAGGFPIAFVLLAAAFGLFMADREGAFLSQLALALSIAGQFALFFSLYELFFKHGQSIAGMAFVALVIQLSLVLVMPNRLHRTMSTLFACAAWAVFVRYGLWDEPFWVSVRSKAQGPSLVMALLGWLVVWVPVSAALWYVIREHKWEAAAAGLIIGLATATLFSQPFESFFWWGPPDTRKTWLSIWPLLSALAALGALAGAYAIASRGLMAICIIAALLHVSHFYYAMGTSLLVKAVIMLVMGAAFLGASHWLKGPRPS
jgi:hypothetical protein